ncbi:MAG: DUF1080 domain-containing protein [Verrucomicrobiota bacterium]
MQNQLTAQLRLLVVFTGLLGASISFLGAQAEGVTGPPAGFKPLFNGKDLDGWFGHGTKDPRTLWAMSDDELKAHQEKTMEDVNKHWSVKDGVLINDGHGLYLTTKKNYGDFELLLDYKTVAKADSGIYLRGVPQVQIWDSTEEAKFKLGANKGSGGLWNNRTKIGKDPLHKMDKPFGEWNHFHIFMIGERVTVSLNGKVVVNNAPMDNFFDKENPIFPRGPIQLQTHGGEIQWRNIFIREIGSEEANRSLQSHADIGFTSLFNGRDLSNWQGAVDNYEVREGTIACKAGKGGTLLTMDEYNDVAFRFEFKLPPGGNNGVALRAPIKGDPAWTGFEIQILDDGHPKYKDLKPWQFHGSVYGLLAAKKGFLRPTGEWNYQEITLKGSHIRVELNGTTIVDQDLSQLENKEHKGLARTGGYVGFAGHSDPIQMRNVRIKKL